MISTILSINSITNQHVVHFVIHMTKDNNTSRYKNVIFQEKAKLVLCRNPRKLWTRSPKTQYAWLLTVLCRGKITEDGLFMTPWELFPSGLWLGVEQTSTHVFSVCLKLSHLLRRFRHRTPPFVYSIRNFLWRLLQASLLTGRKSFF